MTSEWIEITNNDGQTFEGYLAKPPTGSGPGIVLLQEIWGVNEHIRTVADQYALDGFVVLAPDIFWRSEPRVDLEYNDNDTPKAMQLLQQLDFVQATEDIAKVVDFLRAMPEVTGGIAAMGYCMGGHLAYRAASTGKPDAAVCYYGGGIQNNLQLVEKIQQPIIFHYAGQDKLIPPDAVELVRAATADKRNVTIFDYPNADHGFNCWARPTYNQKTSALAHGRTLSFLAKHI